MRILALVVFGITAFFPSCSIILNENDNSQEITIPKRANDNYCEIFNDTLVHDKPRSQGVAVSLKRAQQLARLRWTPIGIIPRVGNGGYYSSNTEYIGIPYSLVMHVNSYVGLDVSLYTFMTSVCNPYSVLYTENVREAPYNGVQCAPYYGTVCSTAVWYALGVKIPYFTRFVPFLDILSKPQNATAESIELCDILLSVGHMVMVYDIGRNQEGHIEKVTIFECNITYVEDTKFKIYTFDEFIERWERDNWVIYRYNEIDNNTVFDDYDFIDIDNNVAKPFIYDKSLCTSRGDKVSYREGENVIINIFDTSYSNLEVYRDDILVENLIINESHIELEALPYGDYKVRLSRKNKFSSYINFEILDVNVDVKSDGEITASFHSNNAIPEYMDICTSSQSPQAYYPFSDADINAHQISVAPVVKDGPLFCKVYFRGKYGRVSNVPILI